MHRGCRMDIDISDKVVVITGSSRGIGGELAIFFAKKAVLL